MNGSRTTVVRDQMPITIRLTKVEVEMLKELQKMDKRYKRGLETEIRGELRKDFTSLQS
jgi:hypothetical protein